MLYCSTRCAGASWRYRARGLVLQHGRGAARDGVKYQRVLEMAGAPGQVRYQGRWRRSEGLCGGRFMGLDITGPRGCVLGGAGVFGRFGAQ